MATAVRVLPDSIALVIAYLSEFEGVSGVGASVPEGEDIFGMLPFVQVSRAGGSGDHVTGFDNPVLDVDVWALSAGGLGPVQDAMGTVRAALGAIRWTNVAGGIVTAFRETVGPGLRPEDDPKLNRLGITIELTVRSST